MPVIEIKAGAYTAKTAVCTQQVIPECACGMNCPFCGHELNMKPVRHFNKNEEEFTLGCENCGAIGAIYRKKG